MNAIVQNAARGNVAHNSPNKTGIVIFGSGLSEGLEAAFAIAVMLAAAWLLASGYV